MISQHNEESLKAFIVTLHAILCTFIGEVMNDPVQMFTGLIFGFSVLGHREVMRIITLGCPQHVK